MCYNDTSVLPISLSLIMVAFALAILMTQTGGNAAMINSILAFALDIMNAVPPLLDKRAI